MSSRKNMFMLFLSTVIFTSKACNPGGGGNSGETQPNIMADAAEGKAIFKRLNSSPDGDVRCAQKGVENCFYVRLNADFLDSLSAEKFVKAFDFTNVKLKLASKNGNYYLFSSPDGQQSSITVRQRKNGPSIYGSIRTGDGVYAVESCSGDGGCNVVTFTSTNFFNQLESKDDAVNFG